MTLSITLAVLLAAFLHAGWNFLVKKADDKLLSMSAMVIGNIPFALAALLFAPWPNLAAMWPYTLGSMLLHTGYQWVLLNAYRFGDLSQVYPLARGVAPLLVTLFSVTLLGVALNTHEWLAILLITSGILSLALLRQRHGAVNRQAVLLALLTGLFIAAYSLCDGVGARASESPVAYYALGSILSAVVWMAYMRLRRPGLLRRVCTTEWKLTLQNGGASFIAYAIVVWAFTQAPIALVTALRETSIIFAMLLGVWVLHERMDARKLIAATATLAGVLALRLG